MKIGIDVDGVLADFNTAFIERVVAVTGRDLFPPRPFDIPTWNYPEHYGYTKDEVSAVWASIKADQWFWNGLPLYDGTFMALAELNAQHYANHDVYFITARPGVAAKRQTELWLKNFGFKHPTVLISANKAYCAIALELDAYIDDKDSNAQDVAIARPVCKVFLMDRPWNAEMPNQDYGIARVTSVMEMLRSLGPCYSWEARRPGAR